MFLVEIKLLKRSINALLHRIRWRTWTWFYLKEKTVLLFALKQNGKIWSKILSYFFNLEARWENRNPKIKPTEAIQSEHRPFLFTFIWSDKLEAEGSKRCFLIYSLSEAKRRQNRSRFDSFFCKAKNIGAKSLHPISITPTNQRQTLRDKILATTFLLKQKILWFFF